VIFKWVQSFYSNIQMYQGFMPIVYIQLLNYLFCEVSVGLMLFGVFSIFQAAFWPLLRMCFRLGLLSFCMCFAALPVVSYIYISQLKGNLMNVDSCGQNRFLYELAQYDL